MKKVILALALAAALFAQNRESSDLDPRLPVHTLVREDLFAGFLAGDMERLARSEKNLQTLLTERPKERGQILALQAGAGVCRAVLAHEASRPDEFQKHYSRALQQLSDAAAAGTGDPGVAAITGGIYVVFADRLPDPHRAAAWSQAYDSYRALWKVQGAYVEKLPVHLKGELLAGMAQSAQRTGRASEATEYLDKILHLVPGTGYESVAKKWKEDPASAAATSLACHTCHESGRLAARRAKLPPQ